MSAAQQFKAGQRVLIRFSYNPAKPAAGRVVRTKKSMLPIPAAPASAAAR